MIGTADEFVRLVTSDDPADRRRAAWEDADGAVWESLLGDQEMRFWVAHNRTIPAEIMRVLAADEDWRVRDRIATKNACPGEILELLSTDTHDAVASTVAGHPNTPDAALRRLAVHPWEQVREKALHRLAARGLQP